MTEVLSRPAGRDHLSSNRNDEPDTPETTYPIDAATPETPLAGGMPAMSPVPLSELLTRKQRKRRDRAERRERHMQPGHTRRRLGVAALCLTTSLGLSYEAFMFDQNTLANMVWGSDKASFTTLYEHYEDASEPETYVYVIPGTGIKDAAPRIADPLMPSFSTIPNVKYMALKEGAHPQINDTHTALSNTINKNNLPQRVIFEGMSAGGKEALDLAAYIRNTYPDIDISVILSSSPYDQDSAYQLRGSNNVLPMIADVSDELNLRGGPVTRFFVEMYDRRRQCWDDNGVYVSQCIALAKQVAHDKLSADSSSNELFEWQVEWTRVNSAAGDIATLKNQEGKGHTSILYIKTTEDTIVDDTEALTKYAADAAKNNIPFDVISLNTPHASEQADAALYNTKVIKPYLSEINDIYATIDAQEAAKQALLAKANTGQSPSVLPSPSSTNGDTNIAAR